MSSTYLSDMTLIVPELILVGMALALLLGANRIQESTLPTNGTILAGLGAILAVLCKSSGSGFADMITVDAYARFFKVLIAIALILTTLLSMQRVDSKHVRTAEYHVLLLLAASGMMFAASSLNLITLYLGLELTTVCSYILVGITVDKPKSNEAAIKYFLLGSFASALFLYGIALAYGATGSTSFGSIAGYLSANSLGDNPLLVMAAVLVAAGLAFKIAAVPFHAWAPDAYEGAHTPVAAFLATASKVAGLAALGRVCLVIFASEGQVLSVVLGGLAALSIMVGSVLAMVQTNIKRLLAYSSIAHAGYALLGFVAGTASGTEATMTYAFLYVFMTLGAFGVVIMLEDRGEDLEGYQGLALERPKAAALMLLFLLALTGIPPTSGFIAKFVVILNVVHEGYYALAILAVACSVISAFVYLRVAVLMYMKEPSATASAGTGETIFSRIPVEVSVALAVAALVTVIGGIFPFWITAWAEAPIP
ncbi:MAG: NADH-quinone oxidoreductase subunit N [Oleiphilaceae bacterium]|nr:NADH-quinone oxidoreductase subunit N [Oleiphilaceae bacterium]